MERLPLVDADQQPSRFSHRCVIEFGFGAQLQMMELRFAVLETRYEDERGYFYDKHLCPGRAIVAPSKGGAGYTRRMLLETLHEASAPGRSRRAALE